MDFPQYSLGAQLCNCSQFLASMSESKYVAEKLTLIVMNHAILLLVDWSQLKLVTSDCPSCGPCNCHC